MEVKLHRLAKFKKMDALEFSYDVYGKPRLTRPSFKANAIAMENLGRDVVVSEGPLYEVRNKHG